MAFRSSTHHHTPHLFFTKAAALLLLSFHAICCSCQNNNTTDTLLQGQSITQNRTLISHNKRYALGFFSPTNPPYKYYVGIWFHQIPNRTVVWVCNRENPLTDPSAGSFTITPDGNLAVVNANNQAILWSTNISSIDANTSAVLLDSGNLVLQRIANDAYNNFTNNMIWQSFDRPSDTLLPDMKLYMNLSTRTGNRLVSWRTPHDPSPGEFSLGLDPNTNLQLMLWKGTQVRIRGSVFTGKTFTAARDDASSTFVGFLLDFNNQSINYYFRMGEGSKTLRVMLDPEGADRFFLWEPTSNTWRSLKPDPRACYYYNSCGVNAACGLNSTGVKCACLRGYVPKSVEQWREGNYKGGCKKEVGLECGDGDGFAKVSGVFLPDGFEMVRDASREECEGWCTRRCGCTAYAFANKSVIGSRTRCLVWEGDLVDAKMTDGVGDGEDLYLRLAASELGTSGSSSKGKTIALSIILPLLALGIILLGIFLYLRKKRSIQRRKSEIVVFEDLKIPETLGAKKSETLLALDFNKLVAATNNFSIENKIGEGGFGPVYKGKLHGGQEIAIKMLSRCSNQGFTQFRNEVELIARLQHRNLVRILGWCIHDDEKMLIYEYMPNKSLDKFIFDPLLKGELNWAKRLDIIHGIAQGLLYLHKYSRLRIVHRDLKTSNILLDEAMNPRISDFGIAKTIESNQNEANTERVIGTLGYTSPEYAFDGLFSEKSDVFSFGVIMLEIITGKKVTGYYPHKKSFNLLGYVWQQWLEGKSQELSDDAMGKKFSEQEVLRCIQIALLCVQESAFDRPSTQSLVSMLTTENATLPSPKQLAFSVERYPDSLFESSTSIFVDASNSSDLNANAWYPKTYHTMSV